MLLENAVAALVVARVEDEEAPEGWRVDGLESLDWALSRVADLEQEQVENERIAKEAIQRVELKTQALNERLQKGVDFFRNCIRSYAEAHRPLLLHGGKKKSRIMLHGTIQWRTKGALLEVKDPGAALDWAREQSVETGVLRIKEELDKKGLNAHHEKTGEVPPGCERREESEELLIQAVPGGINVDK